MVVYCADRAIDGRRSMIRIRKRRDDLGPNGPSRVPERHRDRGAWNHNAHYYGLVRNEVPTGARRALDVGCGDGALAEELHHLVPNVIAIDRDGPSIVRAGIRRATEGVSYIEADFLLYPFESGSFDFISCVAALHHMDEAAALARMRDLLGPGGRLVIIGLARTRYPADLPHDIAGTIVNTAYRITRPYRETASPKTQPRLTFPEIGRLGHSTLPGCRYRRLILWRYLLTWSKPAD